LRPIIALSDAQPPPLSTILTTLIHDLAQCSHEMMLILDDYQVVEDLTIQEAMRFLLDHLPANLHLILSSRKVICAAFIPLLKSCTL
jgi:LuxR family maltose regulon positive regulatory protein